jgi:hypothetical protein
VCTSDPLASEESFVRMAKGRGGSQSSAVLRAPREWNGSKMTVAKRELALARAHPGAGHSSQVFLIFVTALG